MSSSIRLTQQQKLQQKLSPAQIQVIRMLELPACDLLQRVNEELQENPALEEGVDSVTDLNNVEDEFEYKEEDFDNPLKNDDFNYEDYVQDDEVPDYSTRTHNYSGDNGSSVDIPFSVGTSFGEYLKSQVYLTKMTKPQRHIAKFVVGNIDEDGYLRRSPEELVDDLAFREGIMVSDEEMKDIIEQIKLFDPPGVGAKDLQECLLIQITQKGQAPVVQLAHRILKDFYTEFTKRHFDKICTRLNIDEDTLRAAITEITRLNPKPGSAWAGTVYDRHQLTVIPDFYIENHNGDLVVQLNNGDIPDLHISSSYFDMLEDYSKNASNQTNKRKEEVRFIKNKIDSARWFIDAIKQRNETLFHTMTAIVESQRAFFLEGDETFLKPMILQDIADKTGYDVSTISRVSNSKYVQTQFGIYPLKFFFSEKMTNTSGEEISTREIKRILKEVIDLEDKSKPLNDDQLVLVMHERGYKIARRTVAKYRELMGLPVARLRKQM